MTLVPQVLHAAGTGEYMYYLFVLLFVYLFIYIYIYIIYIYNRKYIRKVSLHTAGSATRVHDVHIPCTLYPGTYRGYR